MKKPRRILLVLMAVATLIGTQAGCRRKQIKNQTAQKIVGQRLHLKGYYRRLPWKQGGRQEAMTMALAGTTVPLAQFPFTASKDGQNYTSVVVGTSPFSQPPTGSTINAVIVPLKVTIGSTTFDPTVPNSCDLNMSALNRFRQSPLANDVPGLTMNGIDLGNVQFINGQRRAEFWTTIQGSPDYQNELHYSFASPYTLTAALVAAHGTTAGNGCAQIGILSTNWLDGILQSTVLPALTTSGVVSPTAVVLFLFENTVQSDSDPPDTSSCCILGYHSAVGAPVQTYATIDWDTSGNFSGTSDASIASHEIGEWMDDPLAYNATPPWGNVGQVSGCQDNWEVGDPLSGTLMPPITLNGKEYQMQELAFFSWYFNKDRDPSVGAGGKFSSNGTFQGPAKACPPGGTN
jgi:hypothetical protein